MEKENLPYPTFAPHSFFVGKDPETGKYVIRPVPEEDDEVSTVAPPENEDDEEE